MKIKAAVLCASVLCVSGGIFCAAETPASQGEGKLRVFFCGNSFHRDIQSPLASMFKVAGVPFEHAGRSILSGSNTSQHWDVPDEQSEMKKALRAGRVDVLTLGPGLKSEDPAIEKFVDLLLEHNPRARVLIQASWRRWDGYIGWTENGKAVLTPMEDGGKFTNDKRDNADPAVLRQRQAQWQEPLARNIVAMNARWREKLGRQAVFLVPTAEGVHILREQVAAGKVPNVKRQSELFKDELGHAARIPETSTSMIDLMNAYCFYAVITGQSPIGLGSAAKSDKEMHQLLQEIAWQAVTAEPLSGVKAR